MTAGEQDLQLVRKELLRAALLPRPVSKTALRQPLLAEPKSLTIIGQDLDRRPAAIAKHEHGAGERIGAERFSAYTHRVEIQSRHQLIMGLESL